MEESYNPCEQDTSDQEDDTLSLSDLPLYGCSGGGETPGNEDLVFKEYTSSLSFEFFSGEWNNAILNRDPIPNDNNDPTLVLCGKIIPDKETDPQQAGENSLVVADHKKRRKLLGYRSLAWWNFNSLSKSSSYKSNGSTSGRSSYVYNKGDHKDEVPLGRISIVTTAPKTKWYVFIFGLARLPPKMHVRDLRRRQGSSRTSKRSDGGSIIGGGDGGSNNKGLGWWALIRVLGCAGGGDDHATAVVKATYGSAPGIGV